MKKQVTREIELCDICEKNEAPYSKCLGCSKAICYECRENHAVEYPHALHFSGSNDGLYCNSCITRLKKSGDDPLFDAYLEISSLRYEWERSYKHIERRSKSAKTLIAKLRKERGL